MVKMVKGNGDQEEEIELGKMFSWHIEKTLKHYLTFYSLHFHPCLYQFHITYNVQDTFLQSHLMRLHSIQTIYDYVSSGEKTLILEDMDGYCMKIEFIMQECIFWHLSINRLSKFCILWCNVK